MSADPSTVTSLAELRKESANPPRAVTMGFDSAAGFDLMQRASRLLAASTLVPQQYQGNLPNCVIALNMANRMGADPLLVMQNLYLVHSRPGWSAKFLIASFNQCRRFSAIRYEWVGERDKDSWGCRAWATEKSTGEKIVGPLVTISLAKKEGWYEKSGSKWKTIPELMLQYRAAAWMVNTYAPEISMGLNTAEEIHDVYEAEPDTTGSFTVADLKGGATVIDAKDVPAAPADDSGAGGIDFETALLKIDNAKNSEAAAEVLDFARGHPRYAELSDAFKARWVSE